MTHVTSNSLLAVVAVGVRAAAVAVVDEAGGRQVELPKEEAKVESVFIRVHSNLSTSVDMFPQRLGGSRFEQSSKMWIVVKEGRCATTSMKLEKIWVRNE